MSWETGFELLQWLVIAWLVWTSNIAVNALMLLLKQREGELEITQAEMNRRRNFKEFKEVKVEVVQ